MLFEKMTHEQYNTVIESKTRGAWSFPQRFEGPAFGLLRRYLAENVEAASEVSRNLGSDTIC